MAENENNSTMHEALLKASDVLTEAAHHNLTEEYINECLTLIHDALTAPPRNCDVGTADEQAERFDAFCAAHHFQSEKCCSNCPCHGADNCEFKWGQLPYEGKGKDNG